MSTYHLPVRSPAIRRSVGNCRRSTGHCAGWLLLAATILLGWTASARAFDSAAFDPQVETLLREWNQPGLAVAVVENGRIAEERGFGVLKEGSEQRVNAQTLFGIASLSKSFASATVAKLVGTGQLDWDAPVTRYLPWFRIAPRT